MIQYRKLNNEEYKNYERSKKDRPSGHGTFLKERFKKYIYEKLVLMYTKPRGIQLYKV